MLSHSCKRNRLTCHLGANGTWGEKTVCTYVRSGFLNRSNSANRELTPGKL